MLKRFLARKALPHVRSSELAVSVQSGGDRPGQDSHGTEAVNKSAQHQGSGWLDKLCI